MHLGHRTVLRLLTLVTAATASVVAPDARAYHTDEQRLTDHTAYTLRARDLRLGLFKFQYGIWDPFLVGTHTIPAFVRMANLHIKWRYLNDERWAAAVQAGSYRLDVSKLEAFEDSPGDAVISAGTLEPSVSYRFDDRFTLSSTLPYTVVRADGSVNSKAFDGALTAAVDNLQLTTTLEWRLTRVTALVLHSRYLIFQRAYGDGHATLRPDEYTTVEIEVDAQSAALDFKGAWSVVPTVAFSWGTFNLQIGLGYGNWSIAPLNFVLPKKTLIPDLEVFWVF